MEFLSEKIKNLPVSETLAMAEKARELRNSGTDIIGLSLGEPGFNTPDFIKKAAIKAIDENYNSYSPVDGYSDLKKSICKLDEVIDICKDKVGVNLEIKEKGFEDRVVDQLRANFSYDKIFVTSFSSSVIRKVKSLDSKITAGLLLSLIHI